MEQYVINSKQLAERLQTNPQSIRAYRAGQPHSRLLDGLPEPAVAQPKLLWLVRDIEAWLDSKRTFRAGTSNTPPPQPSPTEGKRGAPTKAERLAARAAGLTVPQMRAREGQGKGGEK